MLHSYVKYVKDHHRGSAGICSLGAVTPMLDVLLVAQHLIIHHLIQ